MSQLPARLENKTELVIMQGDLSKLTPDERMGYVANVCHSLGLNPLTRPFEFVSFQGKMILYARKDCTDQLRKIHGVSITDLKEEILGDMLKVTAKARDKTGKEDVATGVLPIKGLSGNDLANAHLKCESKAKRRVTLSICGLGLLDETEVEDLREGPTRDQPAMITESVGKYDDMLKAFRDLGVSKNDILGFCDVSSMEDISDERANDLRCAYQDLKHRKATKQEIFGVKK